MEKAYSKILETASHMKLIKYVVITVTVKAFFTEEQTTEDICYFKRIHLLNVRER